MGGIILWLAQGFGVGRIPFAPGTFGSAVGFLWVLVLVRIGNFWLYLAGLILGVFLSIWLSGAAEKILKRTDPPSVVLDEIAAMPLCFLVWVAGAWFRSGQLPAPESFVSSQNWFRTVIVFVLFRFFDIAKPWPVRQSQKLPGGWGVTVDDLLAALYVAALTLLFVR
jgi:phosphatidylglycerophosphatase A